MCLQPTNGLFGFKWTLENCPQQMLLHPRWDLVLLFFSSSGQLYYGLIVKWLNCKMCSSVYEALPKDLFWGSQHLSDLDCHTHCELSITNPNFPWAHCPVLDVGSLVGIQNYLIDLKRFFLFLDGDPFVLVNLLHAMLNTFGSGSRNGEALLSGILWGSLRQLRLVASLKSPCWLPR